MVCWLFRLMISQTIDKDDQPSGTIQEHVCKCRDCREFYNTCQSLGENLTREAAIANDKTYRRLNRQVIGAISTQRIHTQKPNIKLWISATAACIALFFLLGALLMLARRDGPGIVQPKQSQIAEGIQELRIIYSQVGSDLPIIRPGVIEKPLANEFKSLTNDTQSAVRFLVACVTVDIAGVERRPFN